MTGANIRRILMAVLMTILMVQAGVGLAISYLPPSVSSLIGRSVASIANLEKGLQFGSNQPL